MLFLTLLAMLLAQSSLAQPAAPPKNLDMYWVDVEGGAATLIVAPSGESLLIDSGFAAGDRDAKRIYAAAQQAGLKKIDFFVLSHFHADHAGGLAALSKLIPIGKFYAHGEDVEKENQQWFDSFKVASAGKYTIVKPGDNIPISGLQVLVVASNEQLLPNPVNGGGPNPLCAEAEQKAASAPENRRSVGLLLSYGKFKYLNLVDMDWEKEMEL